jgi:hypothetical protein
VFIQELTPEFSILRPVNFSAVSIRRQKSSFIFKPGMEPSLLLSAYSILYYVLQHATRTNLPDSYELGKGMASLDARFFGRREIIIPHVARQLE